MEVKINLSHTFFTFAFTWHYAHGEESSYFCVGNVDVAMVKTGKSFGLSVVSANDIQMGSLPGLRKIRRDICRLQLAGNCGNGKLRNEICPNVGECCSQYGWGGMNTVLLAVRLVAVET
jgi:hypothetical protein